MKTVTTNHTEVGYGNNVAIVAEALRLNFGFNDNSHLLTTVAAHVWSVISGSGTSVKEWGTAEVQRALDSVRARLADLYTALGEVDPEAVPLRLAGLVRKHTCGNTVVGNDVALMRAGDSEQSEPVAILSGPDAVADATRIITAVNGRQPRFSL